MSDCTVKLTYDEAGLIEDKLMIALEEAFFKLEQSVHFQDEYTDEEVEDLKTEIAILETSLAKFGNTI